MTAEFDGTGDPAGTVTGSDLSVGVFLVSGLFSGASPAQTLRNVLHYVRTAERSGFTGVWFAEHHFISYGVCPSAIVLAAHVLGATRAMEVGTAAAILSVRHPVALAEEAALLDCVSNGRFRLGVARGGPWVDLEVFGSGSFRYDSGFAESLDLLLCSLREPTVEASGDHFRFRPVAVMPHPERPIPVWVAATSEATVDVASRRGLPLLLGMHEDEIGKAAMLARHGSPGLAHTSTHLAHVADTRTEAEAVLRSALPRWLARTNEYVHLDGTRSGRDLDAYLEHLLRISAIGSADDCVERLSHVVTITGVRRLLLMVEAAGDPALISANIERLGAEVIPRLFQQHPPPCG